MFFSQAARAAHHGRLCVPAWQIRNHARLVTCARSVTMQPVTPSRFRPFIYFVWFSFGLSTNFSSQFTYLFAISHLALGAPPLAYPTGRFSAPLRLPSGNTMPLSAHAAFHSSVGLQPYSTPTSAVLRLECSIYCISGSMGHQQNIVRSFSHCQRFF